MNDPPTAVGGIPYFNSSVSDRLGMNDPPTAVGGIPYFDSSVSVG